MPRQIVLASRPSGMPAEENFALTEAGRPDLADGEIRVRNLFMSVDPYMRGRMNDVKSYVPPFALGAPLEGAAVGEVVASRSDQVPVGSVVLHGLGWRESAVVDGPDVRVVDPATAPKLSAYLGVPGMPGLTAHVGL